MARNKTSKKKGSFSKNGGGKEQKIKNAADAVLFNSCPIPTAAKRFGVTESEIKSQMKKVS